MATQWIRREHHKVLLKKVQQEEEKTISRGQEPMITGMFSEHF